MFVYTDNVWGDSASWNRHVAPPGDIHLAHFVTTKSYPAGNWLPLEAGVRNTSWFFADDQNISMSVDLDLGLDAVLVHSRPDPTVGLGISGIRLEPPRRDRLLPRHWGGRGI